MSVKRAYAVGLAVCAAVVVTTPGATAQETLRKQGWLDYNPSWRVSRSLEFYGDIGARTELTSGSWRLVVIRPCVRYDAGGGVFLTAGVGSFYSFLRDADDQWELRPWQGVSASWPRSIRLEHYVRIEERVYFSAPTWDSQSSLRTRYLLSKSFDLKMSGDGRYWRLVPGLEGFLTLGAEPGERHEQARAIMSVEHSPDPDTRLRFEAILEKARRYQSTEPWTALYLRLRVYQRLR